MKFPDNIREVSQLPIDMMGFIFYEKSPRYINDLTPDSLNELNPRIERVGVFVNESFENIRKAIAKYSLNIIQLHGNESSEFCRTLRNEKIKVIKAFSIKTKEDICQTEPYENQVDLFLFDTKTAQYGGSGEKFDWEILSSYQGKTPFILSGGINEQDMELINNIRHPFFFGIDLNSRFEISPGKKEVKKLEQFIKKQPIYEQDK